MKPILAILLGLALLTSAIAEDFRTARFDLKRVFEQYQRTKDLEAAISNKRNSRRPGETSESVSRYQEAKQHVEEVRAAIGRAQAGTPERSRSELQLQVAMLTAKNLELQIEIERTKREKAMLDESRRLRTEVIQEIGAAAKELGSERGYSLLVPENVPSDDLFLTVAVSGTADDLTEPLLARLNAQYAAKKSK